MFRRRQPPPPKDPRSPRRRRRRRSPWLWVLTLIGAATVLYLLLRFAIVPLLVWMGGGAR